jgi:hypothetical protein
LVHRLGQLTEAQSFLVVEIAKNQQRLFGGTENFLVTREFREMASEQQRFDLLRCLFAVAAADATISSEEEAQLWQVAGELGFSRAEFTEIRVEYSQWRSVLQPDRSRAPVMATILLMVPEKKQMEGTCGSSGPWLNTQTEGSRSKISMA